MSHRYELILVGRDRAIEPRSSNTTILITVLDENDNDPVILNIESGVTTEFVPEVWQTYSTAYNKLQSLILAGH